jgi:proteasome accessory factor B
MAANKLERLLNLLMALLHTEVPLTREELKERVPGYPDAPASFRRAFERDKDDLRNMGVPIVLAPSPAYDPPVEGYRVRAEDYYIADPGLEADELAALHLAASLFGLEGISGTEALWQLGGTANSEPVTPLGAFPTDDNLGVVFAAVRERSTLGFDYRGERRSVDPWRLDFRKGNWYLTGHDHDRSEERNFRLDRIDGEVEPGPAGSFEPNVSAEARPFGPWRFGDEDQLIAEVLVDADHAAIARRSLDGDGEVEERPDGSVVIKLVVRQRAAFRGFVLSFLDHAEVLSPPELRDDIVEWLSALSTLGAGGSTEAG